jgi:glucose dehydrogenase
MLKPNKVQAQLDYIKNSGDRITKLRFGKITVVAAITGRERWFYLTYDLDYWDFNIDNWD